MSIAANIGPRLEALLGGNCVILQEEELCDYAVDGVVPSAIVQPASAPQVAELVRFAALEGMGVIALGSRSKINLGMAPACYDIAVDMRGMQQIAHYDAGDMTLSVEAGMPIRVLETVLAEKQQFLPLAVPCHESSTIGGAAASGIDSVLRQQYGSPRDFLIGAEFIDGKGNLCRSGGRVVKNVSGYDLHKLLLGSLGTLGIITRLNFRTFPLAQVFSGFLASFPDAAKALACRSSLEKKGLPLANVELLDPVAVTFIRQRLEQSNQALPLSSQPDQWQVYVSYEGSEALVQRNTRELQILTRERGATEGGALSGTIDAHLRSVLREAFDWLRWSAPGVALFRITLPQLTLRDISKLQQIASAAGLRSVFLLRAAAVIYFAVLSEQEQPSSTDALSKAAEEVFATVRAVEGSVVLLHAPQTLKQGIDVWGAKLPDHHMMERAKRAFDPHNIFAPGRFVGGL